MLLLVTIGLVVVGAVSLVIGFVSNSLGPIYLSIACSVIAGIVLVVFSRMARRQEAAPAGAAGAGASRTSWAPSAPAASTPAPAPPSPPPPPPLREPAGAMSDRGEPTRTMTAPEAAPAAASTTLLGSRRGAPVAEEPGFPIEGYDTLRASQIVAQLDDLDLDELDMVREREERGKRRATIIRRVDARIDELEAAEGAAPDLDAEPLVPEPEPEPMPMAAAPAAAQSTPEDFPIADYDTLSSDEIIAMLDDLSDDELDMVAEREEQGRNRVEILDYIDDMFEDVDEAPPAAAAPPAPPAPVKKAPVKKAVAKVAKAAPTVKVPGRKAAAVKAAPARTAKKAPAATVPATGRGAAKKAAVSPGTRAGGRKAAAPAPAGRVAKAVKATKVPTAVKDLTQRAKAVVTKEPAATTAAKKAAAKKAAAKKAAAKRAAGVKKR